MRTRSSSNLVGESSPNPTTSNPKRRNRRRSKQPFSLEESPVDTMADQRTMAELLRAPTEGYAEAIVVPPILAEHFELKHSLINMMTSDQFFGLEKDNPHDHIRWFNKITSTIKYKDVPNSAIKLMLFPFSLAGAARRWLEKEPPRSILTWEDLVSKFINEFFPPSRTTNLRNEISNFEQRFGESFHEAWDRYKDLLRACPHHGFTELHQLDTFYNALNPTDQDSLNSAAGGNLLERSTRDVLTIIENKSKVRNSRNKSIVSQVKSSDVNSSSSSEIAKLTHAVNQQTSAVTTAMTAILKQFQATPPPASVKAIEEICVTCGGAHPYYQCLAADGNTFSKFRDNIQGYVSVAAVNYNQGNSCYRPPSVANQIRPLGFAQPNVKNNQNRFSQPQGYNRGNNFNQDTSYQAPIQQNQVVPLSELEKIKKINEVNIKAMQAQINNVKNELRNEMQTSIQASMSNQTNELKNMMASFFQMNTASSSGSGSLPGNTIANPKGELKAITTRSGLVLDGPSVPMPPPFINPEEDERVEETLTDPELAEYTIKVPPPLVQKAKPPSLRNYVVHQRDPRHPNIPYPSRMHQEKQQEKDEVQIHKFWQMFKQLHINISLADALILILKYQKMLKSLLSNKEKLLELTSTPLNENCSAVILKKLSEKLGDPGKFLIPYGFSEFKCKALADLGASFNLMPLSVWKKLGLPELISTRMTLELANRTICTPAGIARDVFVPVGKFTFPVDFVIVDYESNPRVPLILGRPFLRTARALIDVHGEEMILRDDYLEDLFANEKITNHLSGNPTPISDPIVSSSPTLTSLEESDLIWEEFEAYLASDSFPPGSDDTDFDPEGDLRLIEELLNNDSSSPLLLSHNPLSSSTTSSSPDHLLEEFADELALITFPPGNDDLPFDIKSDLREIEYLLNHDPTKEMNSILKDSVDGGNLADPNKDLVDTIPKMFTDEHTLDYSSPPLYDDVDDDLVELESDNDNVYDDPFDSKEDKIKESKLLIDELDPPRSSDFLPSPECDSVFYEDFSEVDTLTSTNNEDKVFNLGILIHENLFEVTIRVTPDKNVKKLSSSNASLILEDFNPPLYELPFHKEVLGSKTLLSFSSENEEKVFNPGILTSKGVHTFLLSELSHRGPKAFKVINIFESPMEISPCSYGEDIRVLDVPSLHFYPP
ncbi:reverse transcriptase domain-containing protein [Tanacetum coccineum]